MPADRAGWSWLMGKVYGLVARNPASNEAVFEEARLQPGERVLDIGSGAGHALRLAAAVVGPANVFGVDPTAALASTAEKRVPGAKVAVAVAEDLPFDDDTIDVVHRLVPPLGGPRGRPARGRPGAGARGTCPGGRAGPPQARRPRPHRRRGREPVTPARHTGVRRRGGGEAQG